MSGPPRSTVMVCRLNQLEMAGIDLLSAQDATGEARREIDLAAPASGDVGVNVRGPARARGPALDGAQVGAAAELPSPRRARREPGGRRPRSPGHGHEELFSIPDAGRVHRGWDKQEPLVVLVAPLC
jgi:hypothetical protein